MDVSRVFILGKKRIFEDTFLFHISPFDSTVSFLPGQYVFLENPRFKTGEYHPFSIASSPLEKKHLEFCIKIYGDWTKAFCKLQEKSIIRMTKPQGNFIWEDSIENVVFLLGGIGISPIMSMLRFLTKSKKIPTSITILYGNRTPQTIAYKDELRQLSKKIPCKIIHIFSESKERKLSEGYHGFITTDIIRQEVDITTNPSFFVVGPPLFVEKMDIALSDLAVNKVRIKKELLEYTPRN